MHLCTLESIRWTGNGVCKCTWEPGHVMCLPIDYITEVQTGRQYRQPRITISCTIFINNNLVYQGFAPYGNTILVL